jgi:uncharacterized protein (TIGR00255 family)
MTGFARVEGAWESHRWTWELKSVNSRGLDIRHRLPSGIDAFERVIKKAVSVALTRGNVNCNLAMDSLDAPAAIQVNEQALGEAIVIAKEAAREHDLEAPRIGEIMALRGVMEVADQSLSDEDRAARDAEILKSFAQALDELAVDRAGEGAKLAAIIADQVDQIEKLVSQARQLTKEQTTAIQTRLEVRLKEALSTNAIEIDEGRLLQETGMLALKADVAEELDRLDAHISATRELLEQGSPAGRKLDFLAQEFGREANTLASKAAGKALSSIGLDLKVIVDQIREQVQNIE